MYRQEGNVKPAGTRTANFFLSHSWVIVPIHNTLLRGVAKTQRYVLKIFEKSRFELRHYAMPLPMSTP